MNSIDIVEIHSTGEHCRSHKFSVECFFTFVSFAYTIAYNSIIKKFLVLRLHKSHIRSNVKLSTLSSLRKHVPDLSWEIPANRDRSQSCPAHIGGEKGASLSLSSADKKLKQA